ncbi:MAG TPA: ABC transporter permease [Anaerolineaceae bacterium]|nr:ABC transporter permease [Anaerolineaceae bacterium]
MRLLDIVSKDIRQVLRDWKSAVFLLVMPILFTVFFGLVLGSVFSADSAEKDPRLPVGWINQDGDGLLVSRFEALLGQSEVIRPVPLSAQDALRAGEMVAEGELAAVLRVPAGYSQAIAADQPASLEVIADQHSVSGRAVVTALDTVTGRFLGAVESAHLSAETVQARAGFPDEAARQAHFQAAFQSAIAAWGQPPLTVQVGQAAGESAAGAEIQVSGFTQSSAGMIVQFSVFGLINSAMILVLERKTRCLQRMLTTPARSAEIIAGHILAMFLIVFAQEVILVVLGQFVFGVEYLRQPLAVLAMMVTLALWAASLGLLIGAVARREDQVIVLCLIAMFLFSALGGAWFPLEIAGQAFSAVGHVLPTAWAMDGFQNIILRGLEFNSVLLPAGLLLVYALVFFGLAIWRFRFE